MKGLNVSPEVTLPGLVSLPASVAFLLWTIRVAGETPSHSVSSPVERVYSGNPSQSAVGRP